MRYYTEIAFSTIFTVYVHLNFLSHKINFTLFSILFDLFFEIYQINTSNTTFFEDEKTFREIDTALKLRTDTALNTSVNKKEKDFKLKNNSRSAVESESEMSVVDGKDDVKGKKESALGIVDYDSETEKNEEMALSEMEKEDTVIDENSPETVELREKYGLYKTFWGLQSYMSCENSKRFVDTPTAAATTSNTGDFPMITTTINIIRHM
jgi:hypothetical protein